MAWTVEQVLALAPDAASATAGRGLGNGAKWQSAAKSDTAAWGEAKGSGAKPYQVVADLGDGASKCSCPSRKFPCKHALGLLLRLAQNELPEAEPPGWASEWLEKRSGRAAAKAERAAEPAIAKPADPKTAERRWANVLRGLDECEAFLADAVSSGLLSMGATRSWDEMAARMVDAQAPGVARRLRRVGDTIGVGNDWGQKAAAELGSLSLLTQAARNIDALGSLAEDVRTALGIPFRKEELSEASGVVDLWDVLGTSTETEDRVTSYRTWLRGRGTRRWAMHLAFATGGMAPLRPIPGRAFAAEARYFPSAWPLRAHFEETFDERFAPLPGDTWANALEAYTDALAENPWIDLFPVLLHGASLAKDQGRWFAIDSMGAAMPVRLADEARWKLLARTGNGPASLFGEFDGASFRILSVESEGGLFEA